MSTAVRNHFIIADVHGCFDELLALLGLLQERFSPAKSGPFDWEVFPGQVTFVGDLIDRGPASAEVVAFVREGVQRGSFTTVLGNHDEMFLQNILLFRPDIVEQAGLDPVVHEPLVASYRFAPKRVLKHWLIQGGAMTISSYGGKPWKPETWSVPPEDVVFLAALPLAARIDDVLVTHAWADATAAAEGLRWAEKPWNVRDPARSALLWNRRRPADPPGALHISGHTVRLQPLVEENSIGIDTGCCFGNTLTAYNCADRTFYQVRSKNLFNDLT